MGVSAIKARLIAAWIAYIEEFGCKETFTLLQLEDAIRIAQQESLK